MVWFLLLSLTGNVVLFMVLVCGRNEPARPEHNPYREGRDFYLQEHNYERWKSCPYPSRSDDRVLWLQGFDSAYDEDRRATNTCL